MGKKTNKFLITDHADTIYEVCNTRKKAERYKSDYGDGCFVVEVEVESED